MRLDLIKYTWEHKKAFLRVEKKLLGKNTFSGYMHDVDKLFLYLLPIKKETIQKIHRGYSRHHIPNARTKKDYIQFVIDLECARYTKPDKQMNAYDTVMTLFPQVMGKALPILKELKLI